MAIDRDRGEEESLPTGEGTGGRRDVADPHPATEEDYDKIPHPGGARPKRDDVGSNSYKNDGTKSPPRPHNNGSGPQ